MRRACVVEYRLKFTEERVHCGSGVGTGGVDRTFVRDGRGRMFIPGSHIKGHVRERCEQLIETLTGQRIPSPHDQVATNRSDLVARTFGQSGGTDVRCIFTDVCAQESQRTPAVNRAQVRMNRFLGRPEAQALFDTEFAVPSVRAPYRGTVRLWTDGEDALPPELVLLCAGMRLVEAIGATRSTGAGGVEVEIDKITVDGEAVTLADVLDGLDSQTPEGEVP